MYFKHVCTMSTHQKCVQWHRSQYWDSQKESLAHCQSAQIHVETQDKLWNKELFLTSPSQPGTLFSKWSDFLAAAGRFPEQWWWGAGFASTPCLPWVMEQASCLKWHLTVRGEAESLDSYNWRVQIYCRLVPFLMHCCDVTCVTHELSQLYKKSIPLITVLKCKFKVVIRYFTFHFLLRKLPLCYILEIMFSNYDISLRTDSVIGQDNENPPN